MRNTLILIITLVFVGAVLPPPLNAQSKRRGRVDWLTQYSLAMEEALLTRRPVLLTFYTTWCGWCRKLEGSTFQDPKFVELSQHMVPVRVDGDKERGLVGLYRVTGYPTTVMLSRRGEEIARVVGYKPIAPFVQVLLRGLDRREPVNEVQALAEERPQDPEAQYALGDVFLALQQFEAARRTFHEVIALSEAAGGDLVDDARLDIALTYLFNYDLAAAIPRFEGFLEDHPESDRRDQGLFFYGVALVQSGRTGEGLERLDEAARMTTLDYIKFEVARLKETLENGKRG
jgi:thioredoxin-related protein